MNKQVTSYKLQVTGKVIHGDHYGRKLGFPTANLDRRGYARKKLKIRLGIWAGYVEIPNNKFQITNKFQKPKSKVYRSAIVIGPLDRRGLPKIEAYLLGFKGNLYGKKITITLQKYLRPFRKFKNEQQLKAQIKKDTNLIRKK